MLIVATMLSFSACSKDDDKEEGTKMPNISNVGGVDKSKNVTTKNNYKTTKFENTELYNKNDIIVTAKEIGGNNSIGPELILMVENNSEEDCIFNFRNATINDYVTPTGASQEVAAGKKANVNISFNQKNIEKMNIDKIEKIDLNMKIFESDYTIREEDIELSVKTKDKAKEDKRLKNAKTVLSKDGVEIKFLELVEGEANSMDLVFFVENGAGENIIVNGKEVSVNSYMVNASCHSEIYAGKKAIMTLSLYKKGLENNNIKKIGDIEDVEFEVTILDNNYTAKMAEETIKIDLK